MSHVPVTFNVLISLKISLFNSIAYFRLQNNISNRRVIAVDFLADSTASFLLNIRVSYNSVLTVLLEVIKFISRLIVSIFSYLVGITKVMNILNCAYSLIIIEVDLIDSIVVFSSI